MRAPTQKETQYNDPVLAEYAQRIRTHLKKGIVLRSEQMLTLATANDDVKGARPEVFIRRTCVTIRSLDAGIGFKTAKLEHDTQLTHLAGTMEGL